MAKISSALNQRALPLQVTSLKSLSLPKP